jgi:hypothetical protein
MLEMTVTEVPEYEVPEFPGVKFKHHYKRGDDEYKAGQIFLTKEDVLAEGSGRAGGFGMLWAEYERYLAHEYPQAETRLAQIEAEAKNLQERWKAPMREALEKAAKRPTDPNAYFKLTRAQVEFRELQIGSVVAEATKSLLMLYVAQLTQLAQIKLRCLLPLAFVPKREGVDVNVTAFVWHCPAGRDGQMDADSVNPHSFRDFSQTFMGTYGVEEFKKLCAKHGFPKKQPKIQTFNEAQQKQVEQGAGKLINLRPKG